MRLLVVESNPSDTALFNHAIVERQLPYDVTLAATLSAAMGYLQQNQFDLILADHALPDGDGLALLAAANGTPFVLMVRPGAETAVIRAMQIGATNYLLKDSEAAYLTLLPLTIEQTMRLAGKRPLVSPTSPQTSEPLTAREQQWRYLLSSLPDLVFRLRRDGTFLEYYGSQPDHLAIPPAHFLGQNIRDTLATIGDQAMACIEQALQSGEQARFAYQLTMAGTVRDFEARVIPFFTNEVLAIVRDITEQKQAEAALQKAHHLLEQHVLERTIELGKSQLRYRSLFNQSNDAVFILDLNGKHLEVNQRASEMLGYSQAEMVGFSARDIVAPQELEHSTTAFHRLIAGEKIPVYQRNFQHKDGRIIPTEINVELVRDANGAPLHIQSIARDISERLAQERQLRYHASLQHAVTDAVIALDANCIIQSWNTAAAKLYGYSAAEALGQDIDTLLPRRYPPGATTASVRRYVEEKGSVVGESQVQDRNGRWLWILSSVSHIKDERNHTEGFVLISRDVSRSKQAEIALRESEQRLEMAVRAGRIGIWDWDIDSNIIYWDERIYTLFGIKPSKAFVTYDTWENALHPDDAARVKAELKATLQDQQPFDTEYRITKPDGSIKHLMTLASVLRDDHGIPKRLVGISMDITTRKESEAALQSTLQKERELSQLKSRFVSIASHEFRTPLAGILAAAETLTIYRHRLDDTNIDARLDKIRQHVHHMKLLVEDVLQLERIQTGRLEFKPTANNLNQLCQQIIDEFNSQPDYQGRVICNCQQLPAQIIFDERLLRQVFNNLISNGLKYSQPDQLVTISMWTEAKQIYLAVQDQGIGIPQEDMAHLFEPFYRAQNVGTISGTGLGLSIAKQAVEMHNGQLTVTSEPDQGATFTVVMPLIPAEVT